jgi:hypothetical protein
VAEPTRVTTAASSRGWRCLQERRERRRRSDRCLSCRGHGGPPPTTRTSRRRARFFHIPRPSAITRLRRAPDWVAAPPLFSPFFSPSPPCLFFCHGSARGSCAPAFLVVTGDPRLAARLRIRLPSPCDARIRPLQAPAALPKRLRVEYTKL